MAREVKGDLVSVHLRHLDGLLSKTSGMERDTYTLCVMCCATHVYCSISRMFTKVATPERYCSFLQLYPNPVNVFSPFLVTFIDRRQLPAKGHLNPELRSFYKTPGWDNIHHSQKLWPYFWYLNLREINGKCKEKFTQQLLHLSRRIQRYYFSFPTIFWNNS